MNEGVTSGLFETINNFAYDSGTKIAIINTDIENNTEAQKNYCTAKDLNDLSRNN